MAECKTEKTRYDALDGLRIIACIGIVMMHIKENNAYHITGFIYNNLIPSFTNFVFLFVVLSAFGMCCGYLDKVLNSKISFEKFYFDRYSKILPFFAVLVLLDVAISPSKASLIEGFANLTLLFGLFPNSISVIGVGWFLGLIFAFYLIFPFYCVLLKNKRRAWAAFAVSLVLNYVGEFYFDIGRANIVYCLCYLLAGGLVYLYRVELAQFSRKYHLITLGMVVIAAVLYYWVGANTITMLLVAVSLLIYALGRERGLLENRFTKFFSAVSMEVYLSHMLLFRIVERVGIHQMFGNGWLQYAITVVIVLVLSVAFAVVVQKMLGLIGKRLHLKQL